MEVTVPMEGKIVAIKVKVGEKVEEDDEVAVIEAMKMEMPVPSPADGVVKEILVKVGDKCAAEQTLMIIE
ncbi:MAG: Glutaconyl-CoA decarboxylase subunit gamma [Syntrophus sp. PtaB.Bin001]|jgi:acetyl-CoA carboxylase biotin carboxyl carrier protein|nr:MAG: Glutaconyl-CoA decarboxylase subunit gamma [Syntrophus sp. PtaB.Bin001]